MVFVAVFFKKPFGHSFGRIPICILAKNLKQNKTKESHPFDPPSLCPTPFELSPVQPTDVSCKKKKGPAYVFFFFSRVFYGFVSTGFYIFSFLLWFLSPFFFSGSFFRF